MKKVKCKVDDSMINDLRKLEDIAWSEVERYNKFSESNPMTGVTLVNVKGKMMIKLRLARDGK